MTENRLSEVYLAIEDVIKTFSDTHIIGSTKEKRKVAFAPVQRKIEQLRFIASSEAPYIWEGIHKLEEHYKAVFRITVTNGHTANQHLAWAESAIRGIRRELHSFENDKKQ